ncbi:MAG: peptidase M24 [Bacteroidales bacterium 36-12]|nr:MAG: peptidase M24 [Bacteroidales bacterium 36-12]
MNDIKNRLVALRHQMSKNDIAAYIIPGTDPHAGEYIPDYWKERDWISGFTGSAGTAAVTLDKAFVWVDSRYFIQADDQLKGTGFAAMKMGLPDTPDMLKWIAGELKVGDRVGVNPLLFSVNAYATMGKLFAAHGISFSSIDLIKDIWSDRPAIPSEKVFAFDVKYAGKSCSEKIALVRKSLSDTQTDMLVLNALDDIAWLFNIRGNDVDYNPVTTAYASVSFDKSVIYISSDKIDDNLKAYFRSNDVLVKDYLDIYKDLPNISTDTKVLIDGNKLNQSLFECIKTEVVNTLSPVAALKSIKNNVEIEGVRNAMIKDGVALTRFFIWLENNVDSGTLSEISISDKLYKFRAEQDLFYGESFSTIAGYADHGAIVHYKADDSSDANILPEGILLLDSGGQYLDGTTDITRTISFDTPTSQQTADFTLVLKGHIGIATAVFPIGTRGSQLDILARKALWDRGMNYGHGTGHGVGHFLNVHEGPQNIRMDENSTILQPGMIISNEPGLYRKGEYGIRTENLILVVEDQTTDFGEFLKFETLTLFPIDINLIDKALLTDKEILWLNEYHQMVYDKLSPYLNTSEKEWLSQKTKAI